LRTWFGPDPVQGLAKTLRGAVPDAVADMFEDYLGHNEPVLAVEQLFDDLDDGGIAIPAWLAEKIIEAASACDTTRFTPEQVRALVRDPRA
jgi:hypothetical protein